MYRLRHSIFYRTAEKGALFRLDVERRDVSVADIQHTVTDHGVRPTNRGYSGESKTE